MMMTASKQKRHVSLEYGIAAFVWHLPSRGLQQH